MPIVWPPSLPQTPLLSWTGELPEVTVRTRTDTGPAKVRRRYTAGTTDFSGLEILLTESQRDDFETFYNDTTAGGSLRWQWQRPDTGATVDFRFVGRPKYTRINHQSYRVNFDLEALP